MESGRANVLGIALAVAMGGLLLGFDATVISGVVPFIGGYFELHGLSGSLRLGWAVSALGWGAMAGNLLAGPLSDRFGRRAVLLVTALLFLGSALAASLATSFAAFLLARLGSGLAVGVALVTAPVYIAEIAPPERRGRLVSLNQLMIVIGISASFLSNYLLLSLGTYSWRWMLAVQVVPAVVYFVLLTRVPESPRWLLGKGRGTGARQILEALHGPREAQRELQEIRASLASASNGSVPGIGARLRGVFSRRLRFVLAFAFGLAFLQQITGINAVLYYLPSIFAQAGGRLATAFAQSMVVGVVNVAMTVVALRLIDQVGRRPLLLIGTSGMAASLLAISWHFHVAAAAGGSEPGASAPLVLLAIIGFVASFAVSLGPVTWVMLAEIFPNEQRAAAMSLVGFWNALVSVTVTFAFPWELASFGAAGTFLGYGLFALAGLLFLAIYAPETKGRTLEELAAQLLRPARAPV